jgi:hypothetical protein
MVDPNFVLQFSCIRFIYFHYSRSCLIFISFYTTSEETVCPTQRLLLFWPRDRPRRSCAASLVLTCFPGSNALARHKKLSKRASPRYCWLIYTVRTLGVDQHHHSRTKISRHTRPSWSRAIRLFSVR